jgi:hypothetical protein
MLSTSALGSEASMRRSLVVLLAAFAAAAAAQEDAGRRWPVTGIAAPTTELALELYVTIAPAVAVGASGHGTRQFIPITGGRFSGANGLKGEVMAGGADWQLRRPDGVTEVKAIYSIKADDGTVIEVDNQGIIAPSADGAYVRTTPRFHAPQGPHEWLNKTTFVGTITPSPQGGAVIIRVFKVQ